MEDKIQERIDSIKKHKDDGEILFITEEGAMTSKFEDIVKQPVEGLLYDLNRDYMTLVTMAKNSKSLRWVNDMAMANIIEYLVKENSALQAENEILEKELEEIKEEYGAFAKDPFNLKYNYDTTPIPTASKPSVEKTNQNASTIMPGFNDQLNICL